jgi:hypothetical protein
MRWWQERWKGVRSSSDEATTKVPANFWRHVWSSDEAKMQPCSTRFFLCTRGRSTSVPSCRTQGGLSSAPSCRTWGRSAAALSCHTQGGSTASRRLPRLSKFLCQIPWKRKMYNFTLHRKSHLTWWTCATTPTKWLKVLDGCLRSIGGTKPRTNRSNQDLGMSFSKLSITTTNTFPWNYTY